MTVLSIYNTKVLIADDNKILVEIIQEELESFSFEISSVNSGKAALAELETVAPEKSYDLVLLDWKMPGMDGLETANRIKKNPRLLKKPKIIMMTAFSREDIFKIGDKSNLDAFLTKPIIQSLLFDTIMNVFGKQVAKTSRLLQKQASINAESNLLQGMRVLIVEDNIINQQVVREPLVNEDLIVDIANNGREAVLMVNETDFDAVLMDVQMPEMDGIEATQLIRQKPQYEKLPIIAMTAHAMSGDRERCLKAGMNDYITKPIDLNQLFSALKKWIKPKSPLTPFYQSGESLLQKGVGEDEKNLFLKEIEKNEKTFLQKRVGENGENCDSVNKTGAKSPQTQELKFKDVLPNELPDIDMATALKRLGGNRRLYHHLLGDFYLNYQDVATKIYHALKNDELKTALHLVHTVKGVAGNLGIQNLQKISETVEITLGAGDKMTSGLLKQFEITVTEVMKTLACLNNMDVPSEKNFEGCETEKCGATDIAILTPLLQDMAKLLDDGSVQAIKCLPEIKKTLGDHFQTEYQKMEEQLNIFEFEEVLKILAKIAKILNITL